MNQKMLEFIMSAVGDTFEISVKTQDVIGMLWPLSHCSPEEIQKDPVVLTPRSISSWGMLQWGRNNTCMKPILSSYHVWYAHLTKTKKWFVKWEGINM